MADASQPTGKVIRGKMSDDQLLTLIGQYEKASLGSTVASGATVSSTIGGNEKEVTTLEIQRYNALNAYFARPLGNEVENRTQIVLPVVRDTMGWMMPQLMRIFAGAKSICRFDPEGQGDEGQAETETLIVNHVFMQQNKGLLILHDFLFDSLLMSNAYAQVLSRETTKVSVERYRGVDEIRLTQLLNPEDDSKVEVIGQEEHTVVIAEQDGAPLPQPITLQTFDVILRRKAKLKRTVVEALPPEEMRVTTRARQGVEDVAFVAHVTTKTRSDLITEGLCTKAEANALPAGKQDFLEMDELARNKTVDQLSIEDPADHSMQEIEYRSVVIMCDYDGDDVAELRHVCVAGNKIVYNEVIEETIFVSGEAMRMPHRHTGFSIYDLVMDLQVIQTDLIRAGLDNLKIANNLRVAVDWRNVNMDDLLTSRPHGPIRGNGPPGEWISPIQMPSNLVEQVLPALEYLDRLRTNRTGVGKGTMGLDADELQNVTKGGQLAALSAASLILELIARMIAEGVAGIMLKIHNDLRRNQNKPLEFQIAGKWVTCNPAEWRERTQVVPNVGLGSGNREEMRANVGILGAAQEKLAAFGLVGPKQGYETFKLVVETLGFSSPERFAMIPGSPEQQQFAQQQAQNAAQGMNSAPQVQAAKIRAETTIMQEQAEDKRAESKLQQELLSERVQMVHEALQSTQDRQHEAAHQIADRTVEMSDQHLQIILKLIPAIAQILVAEKKQASELATDVDSAGAQIK